MDYIKKLKLKIVFSVLFLLIGICAFSIGLYLSFQTDTNVFTSGYLSGTGAGLIVAGIIVTVKKLILLNNKEKLKEDKIKNEDERNLLLSYKASHYSLILTSVGLYLASFYFAFTNDVILQTITIIICILILVRFLLYFIMRKLV